MKKITLFCLGLFLTNMLVAQNLYYVKADATGTNSGTSWANAFTDLELALASVTAGDQIWIAKGTYKPGGGTLESSFFVATGTKIYGGFAGNETTLSQRNISLNETILSGDIAGNDIAGDFAANKTDNVYHVVRIQAGTSTSPAYIDGVTIKGGHTSTVTSDPAANLRGGGILCEGLADIRNCNFNNNRADSGGCIMVPNAAGSGLNVYNCRFEQNDATVRAAGIYFINLTSATIRKCVFENNSVVRGAFYPRGSTGVVIDSCTFRNNKDKLTDGFGAGIFSYQTSYKMTNCYFNGNTGGSAVSVYNDNRDGGKFAEIVNCVFEANTATNYGGCGVHNFQQNYSIDGCTFLNNTAPSSAGAIYNSDSLSFTVTNTVFEGNTANYAAAVANYGEALTGTFSSCTFRANAATRGGGAVSNGFRANVGFVNCLFDDNSAEFGGAIFTQNDTTRLTVNGCTFEENDVATGGGCIYQNPGVAVNISNSTFKVNSANFGAALYAEGDSAMVVTNSIFTDNIALEQAAAVYVSNGNLDMTNCLLAGNLNVSPSGAGGGLLNNASSGLTSTANLTNCTIANNLAPLGDGIAQWEDSDTSFAVLNLRNCLLQNPEGINYAIEAGTPELVSLGGNQSSDESMAGSLVATKDLNNTTNAFVNPDLNDYHLVNGPAVDGGVAAGAPTADLEGKAHEGDPDTGCYELGTTGIQQPAIQLLNLAVAPNPTTDLAIVSADNNWTGDAVLEMVNTNGQVVYSAVVTKNAAQWQHTIAVKEIPAGSYILKLQGKGILFRTVLVKQ